MKENDSFYNYREKDIFKIEKLVWVLLLLLILSLTGNFLYGLFDKYIVEKALGLIFSQNLNIFQTLLTSLFSFYGFYLIILRLAQARYILQLRYIILMLLPLLLYIYERFFNNKYNFTQMLDSSGSASVKFLDFPFFLLGMTIMILLVNICEKKMVLGNDNDLLIDLPLQLLEEDKFAREQVYGTLIKQIAEIRFMDEKSFCIGIVNKWAEGKTSFLNFLKKELAKESQNTVIIKFNAWFTPKSDNLTTDFFRTLDEELSKYIYTGKLLRNYAKNLTQVDSTFNLAKYLPQNWVEEPSNQDYFQQIESLLNKLQKRIFVIIDDIDRLDNDEVFEVLRMIRNSANFSHIIFLVPFDKEYALHALKEKGIYKPEEYIKKIFDVEVSLTPIYNAYLQPIFLNTLKDFVSNKLVRAEQTEIGHLTDQLESIFKSTGPISSNGGKYQALQSTIFNILKNNRDIVRFTNSVKLSLKDNFNKMYLPDLLSIELIKYQDLALYRRLFESKRYLVEKNEEDRKVLELFSESKDQTTPLFSFLGIHNDKEILFAPDVSEAESSKKARTNIIEDKDLQKLVQALFNKPWQEDYNAKLSIYYEMNYLNYVQFNVGGISYDELDYLIDG